MHIRSLRSRLRMLLSSWCSWDLPSLEVSDKMMMLNLRIRVFTPPACEKKC